MKTGLLTRKDVFIPTKVCHPENFWNPTYKRRKGLGFNWEDPDLEMPTKVAADIQASMLNPRIENVELWLMHWPGNYDSQASANRVVVRKKVWEALENAHRPGHAKALGICNFVVHQQKLLMTDVSIKLAADHTEGHPYCIDEEMVSFARHTASQLLPVHHLPVEASGSLRIRYSKNCLRSMITLWDR